MGRGNCRLPADVSETHSASEYTQTHRDSTTTPTPEPPLGGKGFLLSFNGDVNYPISNSSMSKSFKQYYFDSTSGSFVYPSSGFTYSENQFLLIVLNPVQNARLVLSVHSVSIPTPNGENDCGFDTLNILGPYPGTFQPRLR